MADHAPLEPIARQGHVPVAGAQLFYRDVGKGPSIVVLHGGPDFDHNYLLPEMDGLSRSFRLIYYDQRGRGRSGEGVEPEHVTIASEVKDLDELRRHFDLESFVVLAHSWGGVLAMEYAVRHPDRVSHLILMNTAPASYHDRLLFRQHLLALRPQADHERMQQLSSSPEFRKGSLSAEAEYYRIHFRVALAEPLLDRVIARLRAHFTAEGVLLARAIEHRLYQQTWLREDYDLLPSLSAHPVPTLVIHGDQDFVPLAVASRVAEAIPGALFEVLSRCGHFAYLEYPDLVFGLIGNFLGDSPIDRA